VRAALAFRRLRSQNVARANRWHPGFPDKEDPATAWTGGDWAAAMAGECGEACNIVKKLRRIETGHGATTHAGEKHEETELLPKLADELADVVIYTDLLAARYGLDLGEAVRNKFNEVSDKRGYPEHL
jgi:NTP pyrophosphatase (non-canonical NTP hydrolase)